MLSQLTLSTKAFQNDSLSVKMSKCPCLMIFEVELLMTTTLNPLPILVAGNLKYVNIF